jgi:putative endonuclease
MYYLYILQNKNQLLYKGISNNIQRRIKQHNQNRAVGTRGKGPWELVYSEVLPDRKTAREREKYFKSGIGREKLKELVIK